MFETGLNVRRRDIELHQKRNIRTEISFRCDATFSAYETGPTYSKGAGTTSRSGNDLLQSGGFSDYRNGHVSVGQARVGVPGIEDEGNLAPKEGLAHGRAIA